MEGIAAFSRKEHQKRLKRAFQLKKKEILETPTPCFTDQKRVENVKRSYFQKLRDSYRNLY